MHWGLIPFWSDDPAIGNRLINARSETLAEKPAFRTSFRRKRCLVIADGFYEWTAQGGGKQPHYFQMRDDRPFGFAGLWDRNEKLDPPIESCTIITTSANTLVAAYHTRMPVILRPEAYAFWLDPDRQETANLSDLLVPCAPDLLQVQPVSRRVNNPKNDDAACLEPA
jgi:putative SOS response-associated peptidase YedK